MKKIEKQIKPIAKSIEKQVVNPIKKEVLKPAGKTIQKQVIKPLGKTIRKEIVKPLEKAITNEAIPFLIKEFIRKNDDPTLDLSKGNDFLNFFKDTMDPKTNDVNLDLNKSKKASIAKLEKECRQICVEILKRLENRSLNEKKLKLLLEENIPIFGRILISKLRAYKVNLRHGKVNKKKQTLYFLVKLLKY